MNTAPILLSPVSTESLTQCGLVVEMQWVTHTMRSRAQIRILLIVYCSQLTFSAPLLDLGPSLNTRRSDGKETGRIFWSTMGDILEALPFVPFTVNVPDTISSIWGYFSGFFPGGGSTGRPSKKKKGNYTSTDTVPITRQDIVDYFLY